MAEQQPIAMPSELIDSLNRAVLYGNSGIPKALKSAFAAGWEQRGALNEAELQAAKDEQLEACCEWLFGHILCLDATDIEALRAHFRPKPPSLADQALQALDEMDAPLGNVTAACCGTIRAALERLKQLEGANG